MVRAMLTCLCVFLLSCSASHKRILYVDLTEDTVISHPGINNNYANDKEINIYTDTLRNTKYTNRVLLKFNDIVLPNKDVVDSVHLYLYYNNRSNFFKNDIKGHKGYPTLTVHNIISEWNPKTIAWKDSLKLGTLKVTESIKTAYQDIRINITPILVKEGVLTPSKGIFLKLKDENKTNYIHLTSKDGYEKDRVSKLKLYVTRN